MPRRAKTCREEIARFQVQDEPRRSIVSLEDELNQKPRDVKLTNALL